MDERLKELRKTLGITQQEFANKINTSRSNVAGYETGTRVPSNAIICLICKEFRVNEEWLRTGNGDMFQAVTDPVTEYISELLIDVDHPLKPVIYSIMKTYSELNEKNKAVFNLILNEFIENLNNRPKN